MRAARAIAAAIAALALTASTVGADAKTLRVGVVEDAANGRFGFAPSPVTVDVGDTIVFVNDGTEEHNFLSLTETEMFGSEAIAPGGTFEHVFAAPGEIRFICDLHSNMEGQIVVRG